MTKIRKSGLGKGLDSLIPEVIEKREEPVKKEKENKAVTLLKTTEIEPNRSQPRKNFNEDALLELSDSIRQYGVIQPIIVQKKKDYYEIIAGERRWRAAKLAELKEVPVIIKDYSEQEIVEIALIENIQREDLNPIEEAMAYKRLLKEYNLKQDEVADRVSKSRTAVTNSMRLLKLSEQVQQMLIEEMISSGHARALLAIEDKELQYNTAMQVFDQKMSVRETEQLVKSILNPKKNQREGIKENPKETIIYEDIENKIRNSIGTNVKIKRKQNGKGKIEIDYYSTDELDRLVDLFLRME